MNKRIALVGVAVVLALLGTLAVYSYGKHADQRAVAATKGRLVLVAGKRVAAGTSWADAVKNKLLRTETMPADSTPETALTSMGDAAIGQDAVAQSDIAPGQVVLRESFGTKTAQTGVLAIPKGLIALGVALGSDADVANYVGPGAQVVIFGTSKATDVPTQTGESVLGDDLYVTRTVVSRAQVIATTGSAPKTVSGATDTSGAAGGSVTVTIALSQSDAERVIVAKKIGDIYLGLLSPSSQVNANDPGVANVAKLRPARISVK